MEFLEVLFNKGETPCFGKTKYDNALFKSDDCIFFTINPVIGRRGGDFVSAYRNILIEMDKYSVKKQLSLIKKSGIPYTSLVFSGGKSIHCIISLQTELEDKAEYLRYVNMIFKAFGEKHLDTSVKDPARFSRLADGIRPENGVEQSLIDLKERVSNVDIMEWCHKKLGANKFRELFFEPKKPLKATSLIKKLSFSTKLLIEKGETDCSSRHQAFVKAAMQMRHAGYDENEIYEVLEDRFLEMIPERGIKELKHIVKWCAKRSIDE